MNPQNLDGRRPEPMLADTQAAFDSVADIYDGPRGNNALIQRMRELIWQVIAQRVPRGGRLLDIGCGTGIDALHFATLGYSVLATDWSPQMVARAAARATTHGLAERLQSARIGAQQLHQVSGQFDGAYSNFGPLNCVPDLREVARECARVLRPEGHMVFSVIGRICPWELAYYLTRLRPGRALVRLARGMTPVRLNQHIVWTRYYTPREFYRQFAEQFELVHYRALSLFLPPPYLLGVYERHAALSRGLAWLDDRIGGWPALRAAGDHFLMILRKRSS
ncbi:MAG TPA: class I SAM-dependent methyltransferase [Steroidobacteraceae bacterium]|nr:class I SAM-dependent methyltransferase [Steroidobacteraceae bacterium]